MRRAPLFVFLALAALGGCRTCIDAGVPRNYACSGDAGAGVDECPDLYNDNGKLLRAWECNATWGYCFDTTKGEPNPCSRDEQCGGGWRCTPDGRCGDPAQEGDVSTVDVDGSELLHPLVFTQPPAAFESSAPLRSPDGRHTESLLAGRTSAGFVEVLRIQSSTDPDGEHFRTFAGRYLLADSDFAVTVAHGPGADAGVQEFLWSFAPNGPLVQRELLDDGTVGDRATYQALVGATWVAPLLVGGAHTDTYDGLVQVRHPAGLALVSPYAGIVLDGGLSAGTREAAVVAGACADGGDLAVVARMNSVDVLRQGPMGRELQHSFPADQPSGFRLATRDERTWLGWQSGPREAPDGLSSVEVTGGCSDGWAPPPVVELLRPPCPAALQYRSYDLVFPEMGPPELVSECVERDGQGLEINDVVFVGERNTPTAYLPPRVVTQQGDQVFSRFVGGQVTQGPNLLAQDPVSLPQPPETLYVQDGGLFAPTERASFVRTDAGFFIDEVPAWAALPARYIESEDWFIARSGVVIDLEDEQAVVLPEDEWDNPSAFVLSEVLEQPDAGGVLIATHDDAFDVAELGDDQPTLVTRLKPSPATPILSLALQPARDGGTAEGYLVAGLDLFEVRAPTPRRWSASKVALSGLRPVFVWFDHGRPRALLDDGTVMGLYTRVPLSVTLVDEVRAGGELCGAPFALTASELYRLVPSASGDGGARYEWEPVDLPGVTDETDFSRGRLLTLDDALYVFSNSGETWKLSPAAGCSP